MRNHRTPPLKSPRQKAIEQYEKEKEKRAKCRATVTNREMCNDCSMAWICSTEATQGWLKNKDNEMEVIE